MTVRLLSGVAIGIAAIGAIALASQTRDAGLLTSGTAVITGACSQTTRDRVPCGARLSPSQVAACRRVAAS